MTRDKVRLYVSKPPPGLNGTIQTIFFSGKAVRAGLGIPMSNKLKQMALSVIQVIFFIFSSPFLCFVMGVLYSLFLANLTTPTF
jgi:hypothetical protein